jgi:response regulator RpfG family c-di-GMP phosphodiesterase
MSLEGTIVLIGTDKETNKIFSQHLIRKYKFLEFGKTFDIDQLAEHDNILLFIMNVDQPWIPADETVRQIKMHPKFQNVPLIGMALKQHFKNINDSIRIYFEDFILIPNSWEDMLVRVEVWINTYKVVALEEIEKSTFSLNELCN